MSPQKEALKLINARLKELGRLGHICIVNPITSERTAKEARGAVLIATGDTGKMRDILGLLIDRHYVWESFIEQDLALVKVSLGV